MGPAHDRDLPDWFFGTSCRGRSHGARTGAGADAARVQRACQSDGITDSETCSRCPCTGSRPNGRCPGESQPDERQPDESKRARDSSELAGTREAAKRRPRGNRGCSVREGSGSRRFAACRSRDCAGQTKTHSFLRDQGGPAGRCRGCHRHRCRAFECEPEPPSLRSTCK